MAKNKINSSSFYAKLSILFTVVFISLLGLLHIIKPEIDPSWRLISEYQIGNFGWLMSIAFFSLAAAQTNLFIAIRSYVKGIAGHIGLFLLLLSVIGFVIAGIYPPDPITTSPELYSFSMWAHSIGGLPAILGMPLIAIIFSWSLLRRGKNKLKLNDRVLLIILTIVMWVCLIFWFAGSSVQRDAFEAGRISQYEWIGWPNRIFILSYCLWVIAVAKSILKQR